MAASAPELARKNANGVFGALFMPFMSVTLLWILNTDRAARDCRPRPPFACCMAAMSLCCVAETAAKAHLCITTNDTSETGFAMHRIFARIVEFFAIFRAAASIAAAARNHQQPDRLDLNVLGIAEANFRSIRM